jgi:transcriptional regulator with XRE-family HTH domain
MVPKKVGDELRRRRNFLELTQSKVAHALGVNPSTGRDFTRAYVSAVERGCKWDPDADGLVRWAQALGWDEDRILRMLGRAVMSTTAPAVLTADLIEWTKRAVAGGVREGVIKGLQDRPKSLKGTSRAPD